MHMDEITLETERLLLRWLREDDFEQYAEICRDPEVMRFLNGQPLTDIEVWRQMAYFMGHWYFRGYGIWAVEEKRTRDLIGRIVFLIPLAGRRLNSGGLSVATVGAGAMRRKGLAEPSRTRSLNWAGTM